jgi:hypothetical protein
MLFDSINLVEGSTIKSLKVNNGSSFPDTPNTGELFFRTDESKLYAYNGTEWIASGSGSGSSGLSSSLPKITAIQVSTSTFQPSEETAIESNVGGYIKISGTGFVAGCNVTIGETNAVSTQFVDAQTLNVTTPALTEGNYNIYVMNPDGGTAVRVNGISYSDLPVWQTAITLPTTYISSQTGVSIQVTASNAVSYTVAPNTTFPAGLTISSTGLITGTAPAVAESTGVTLSVQAKDAQNQVSVRNFIMNITALSMFTTPGTYAWVAPEGVTSVSVVCIGGGGASGGGGGGLGWRNNIEVVPGQSYTVVVGAGGGLAAAGNSYFSNLTLVSGRGGSSGNYSYASANHSGDSFIVSTFSNTPDPAGGGWTGQGGGNGGPGGRNYRSGSSSSRRWWIGGGGGAGGYSGAGGRGGCGATTVTTDATNYVFPGGGSGGGGGGGGFTTGLSGRPTPWIDGASGGGGGTRLFGSGANGAAGTNTTIANQIAGGGGGGSANIGSNPALGGGGGSFWNGGQSGAGGGVRIIWGEGRSFPNNAL